MTGPGSLTAPPREGELNRLLLALPPVEYEGLQELFESAPMNLRDVVYARSTAIGHVYFPQEGAGSLLAVDDAGARAEIVSVGNEGMIGMALFHGVASSPHECLIQIKGYAKRISAAEFLELIPRLPALRRLLHRYANAMFNDAAQSVTCNRHHSVEERCARWLLATGDRVADADFSLTQEFLSYMLAARRPSVSTAASRLQSDGLIRYRRGVIRILDRKGLEEASCECYGITRASHDQVFE
jgi:CRP-like cAMP-binding protein